MKDNIRLFDSLSYEISYGRNVILKTQHLKNDWIPEYFSCRGTSSIKYIQADTIEGFDIKNKILDLAVASRILSIIRYGDIHAWNAFDYLIETEDDYILFESWTTA